MPSIRSSGTGLPRAGIRISAVAYLEKRPPRCAPRSSMANNHTHSIMPHHDMLAFARVPATLIQGQL